MNKLQNPWLFLSFVVCLCNPLATMAQDDAAVASTDLSKFIESRRTTAMKIIESARADNDGFLKLQELCDDIGHRLSGSESHTKAIEWAQVALKRDGQQNVRTEPVIVRKWVRGKESCELIEPRPMRIDMLGLGGSVGTEADGITAEVIVVDDKDQLDKLKDEDVKGKIVVFNCAMPPYDDIEGSGYGATVKYRSNGATWAAERGAVAALVRSITAYSLSTPHTGAMRYRAGTSKIPTAAITIEAATMLRRLQDRNKRCVVRLKMEARDEGKVPSANVMGEIVGSELPNEIVVIGGHLDSWDVGQGAQDDGAGCVAAMEALNILRKLGLKPRRTIRVVLWTNEENGTAGAKEYLRLHRDEKHVAGIESDSGAYRPKGLSFDVDDDTPEGVVMEQLTSIMSLLKPIGANRVNQGWSGVDVGYLKQIGAVCMGLEVDGRLYFNQHHTWADTVDKVDPKELTDCSITLAVASYLIADLPGKLGN
ncbi:MAG: M20/M25/M40 family metallo-hydrolase [Planctomycetota bacterium]